MLAQDSYNAAGPASHHVAYRRKKTVFTSIIGSPIVRVLMIAGIFCVAANLYIRAYAGVQEKGYRKSDLSIQLKQIRQENEQLRMELDKLRQPDAITQFAISNGMKQNEEVAYLNPFNEPKLAQNTEE